MSALEIPIPGCMNSANLILSSLSSPLNLNTNINRGFRYSSSPRNGPSHHCDSTTRRLHQISPLEEQIYLVTQNTLRESGILSPVVAAAFDTFPGDIANAVVSPSQPLEYSISSNRNQGFLGQATTTTSPTRATRHHIHQNVQEPRPSHPTRLLPPPFRNRAAGSNPEDRRPRNTGPPGRLWNPTNYTPRFPPAVYTRPARSARKRRPSTPPPPSIPFSHPALDDTRIPNDQIATGAGDYPLLTLPEQRQSRHPTPTRSSFQIEGRLGEGKRISVPGSIRYSHDLKRTPTAPLESGSASEPKPKDSTIVKSIRKRGQSITKKTRDRAVSFGLIYTESTDQPVTKIDKGKGKAVMSSLNQDSSPRGLSTDLERGPPVLNQHPNRSNLSLPSGIGSAISSSNSSIIGDPNQPGLGDEWGPQHPCFPHLNPYVPINSVEYTTTRIIRIRRDWLIAGDLAPTFSNMYPEILDPAGIPEQEFRRVIEKLNGSLVPIFNPYSWRNILDGVLGVLTAWFWEDLGLTNVKTKLNELETWIEKWNTEMEKTSPEDGTVAPKIISLRRTGYMSLDFQIPNPEVSRSTSEPASRAGPPPLEPTASART
ncbi:Golgin subfamily A member 7/ERF4 family-domain-containing protein [Nemania sp. FL0031]|nr:Golgin subfamily A member 7/ERF4 family-domain-containing protein [Nemania sp. FL0031]